MAKAGLLCAPCELVLHGGCLRFHGDALRGVPVLLGAFMHLHSLMEEDWAAEA